MEGLMEQTRFFIQEAIADVEQQASQLWHRINGSIQWKDEIFYTLCAVYTLLAAVALVQIIRIKLRVPEDGCTPQKVFHLMNLLFHVLRAVIFGFHKYWVSLEPRGVAVHLLLDLPGILFFSTYALLLVFWARIYYQARGKSSTLDNLWPLYIAINCQVYYAQVVVWINENRDVSKVMAKVIVAITSFSTAMGFLIYGVRLFLLLKRYPTWFQCNRNMLNEVFYVAVICFTCFYIRCFVGAYADTVDLMKHPILNLLFYMLLEILPSGLVLFILRELPSKEKPSRYSTSIWRLSSSTIKKIGL